MSNALTIYDTGKIQEVFGVAIDSPRANPAPSFSLTRVERHFREAFSKWLPPVSIQGSFEGQYQPPYGKEYMGRWKVRSFCEWVDFSIGEINFRALWISSGTITYPASVSAMDGWRIISGGCHSEFFGVTGPAPRDSMHILETKCNPDDFMYHCIQVALCLKRKPKSKLLSWIGKSRAVVTR